MIRVLIAEDNDLVRSSLKNLLESKGDIQIVDEAVDGQEALEKLNRIKPDVLLTDLNMPRIDGYQLIQTLFKRTSEVPVVVLSALSSTPHVIKAFQAGASGFLVKDSSADELLFAIRHIAQGGQYLSAQVSIPVLMSQFE